MIALLFSFILFLFFGFVGFSFLILFSSLRPLQLALVGPAFGMCVVTLPTFFLSRLGLPVGSFATWVAFALGILSLAIIAVKRPQLPLKSLLGIVVALAAALILVGRPMLVFGFDWASYANDDMTNYCLSAARFLTSGYLTPPRLDDYFSGRDYSQGYWTFQFDGIRSGPDLMLAFVWAVSKIDAVRAFMPVICAQELALASAAGSIAAGFTKEDRAPLIAIVALAVSPMASLGVLSQLLAQVGGVAILCAAVALICQPPPERTLRSWLATGAPAVIVIAGLLVWYPESTPFLGVGAALYLVVLGWHDLKSGLQVLAFYVCSALVATAVLNTYALSALIFVFEQQVTVGLSLVDYVRFPYFLIPSGIPAFWGLTQMVDLPSEPYLSIAILFGIIMFGVLAGMLIPQIKKGSSAAIFCALMLVVGFIMELRSADYGLFKLPMFMQPFVAVVIASAIVLPGRVRWQTKLALAAILLCANAYTQADYVHASFGGADQATLGNAGGASRSTVYEQFSQLFDEARRNFPSGVVSDTPSPVFAKFQAFYGRGVPLYFLSNDVLGTLIFRKAEGSLARIVEQTLDPPSAQAVEAEITEHQNDGLFVRAGLDGNTFEVPKDFSSKTNLPLLASNGQGTIFNKSNRNATHISTLQFNWAKNLANLLIFIPSARGNYYYGGDPNLTSFYQLEHDPMFDGQTLSGLGRNILFMAHEPTPNPRLVMEITATTVKQFDSDLPRPTINGLSVPLVGRGSARVMVPIELAEVGHQPYVAIDFGRDGRQFPVSPRSWMMSMFGRDIKLDTRGIVAFGRNLSLISERQYQSLKPPSNVVSFPDDLGNPALEYSGVYEDSWISEHAFFVLEPSPTDRSIRIKGMIPLISDQQFSTRLMLLVDGTEVATKELKVGEYDIRVPITADTGRHKIELVWDKFQRLPGDDGRPTAGRLDFVGYSDEVP